MRLKRIPAFASQNKNSPQILNSYTVTLNSFYFFSYFNTFFYLFNFFFRSYLIVCWAMEFYNYNRSLIYVNTYIEVFCLILQSEIREVFFLLILQSKIRFAIDELPEKYPNPGPAIMSPSSRSLGDIPALSARMRLGFRKKWRLAPRALSCFMRRSFDLLFWNHTWKKKILILKTK